MDLLTKVKNKGEFESSVTFKLTKSDKLKIDKFCAKYDINLSKLCRASIFESMGRIKKEGKK